MMNFENLLTPEEKSSLKQKLRELSEVRPWLGLAHIAIDWLVIFSIIALSEHFFNAGIYVLAVILIATRQHALGVMSHEGAHYRLVNDHGWNTWLANALCAYPLFIQIEVYRHSHLLHHRYTNQSTDPDVKYQKNLPDYQFPMPALKLFKIFFMELLGAGAIANFKRMQRYNSDPELKAATKDDLAKTKWFRIFYYMALASFLTVFGGWKLYLMYWIVPMLWILPMILRLRNSCEHYGLSLENDLQGTRDVSCSWIEGWLLSPHYIRIHLVHHFYPSIPMYNLPKMRKYLMSIPAYRDGGHFNTSYVLPIKGCVLHDLTNVGAKPVS